MEAGKQVFLISLIFIVLTGCSVPKQSTVQQDLDAYTGAKQSTDFTPLKGKEAGYPLIVLEYMLDLKRTTPVEFGLFDRFPVFFSQDIRIRTTSSFSGPVLLPAPAPRFASSVDIYITVLHQGKKQIYLNEHLSSFLKTYKGRYEPGWSSSPHFVLEGLPPETELHVSLVQQFDGQENTVNVVLPGKSFIRQFSFSLNQKRDWGGIDLMTTFPLYKTENLRSTLVDDIQSGSIPQKSNTLKPVSTLELRDWEISATDYLIVSKPGLTVEVDPEAPMNPAGIRQAKGKTDPIADRLFTRLIEPGLELSEYNRNPWITSFVSGLREKTGNDSMAVVFKEHPDKKRDRIAGWMKQAKTTEQMFENGVAGVFGNIYPEWPALITGFSWMIASEVGTVNLSVGSSEPYRSTVLFSLPGPSEEVSAGLPRYQFDFSKSSDIKVLQTIPTKR